MLVGRESVRLHVICQEVMLSEAGAWLLSHSQFFSKLEVLPLSFKEDGNKGLGAIHHSCLR